MNSFPVRSGVTILESLRKELGRLRSDVPMFANWQVQELRRICERYSNMLIWLAWWDTYRERCANLLLSLPVIQAHVCDTLESGDWRAFNRAAFALQVDLEELLGILEP
jgi:hypothetical protein